MTFTINEILNTINDWKSTPLNSIVREPKNRISATCSKRLLGEYHVILILK